MEDGAVRGVGVERGGIKVLGAQDGAVRFNKEFFSEYKSFSFHQKALILNFSAISNLLDYFCYSVSRLM
jgi:hypothetical protein